MNTIAKTLGIALVATTMATGAAWALIAANPRYTNIEELIGTSVPSAKVAKAFKECSAHRGWKFVSNGSGKLIGNLVVRGKHFVSVDVAYSSKAYSITYRDSKNMKYNPETNMIHKRYASWVENLDNDVQFCLH